MATNFDDEKLSAKLKKQFTEDKDTIEDEDEEEKQKVQNIMKIISDGLTHDPKNAKPIIPFTLSQTVAIGVIIGIGLSSVIISYLMHRE